MKSWKKVTLAGAAVLATVAAGAAVTNANAASLKKGTVTLYVDTQQKDAFQQVVNGFTKANPKVTVKVVANSSGSANAKTDIAKDPKKYADVFAVPNDQLGDMAKKGYINPLSPSATKTVKSMSASTAFKGMEYKGKLYAFPSEIQAQTLFYNKSKLSADDVKTWAGLTSKGVLATDFTNAYNFYPVFFSAGTTLYGKSGEVVKGTKVANTKGVNAMKWFAAQKSNKGVMQTSNALNQLKSGAASAIIDGPWDTANIKKILGANYAVAPYPTIEVGGATKQLQAFLGIHGFAVNSYAKDQQASQALAQYITSKSAQLTLFKSQGLVPANKSAQSNSAVKADAETVAVIKMSKPGFSTLMPKLPQMAKFWNDSAPLINGAYSGNIKEADFMAKLKTFQTNISK